MPRIAAAVFDIRPSGVSSLCHAALPFPPDDRVYGQERPAAPDLIYLGNPVLRGERGQLAISPADPIRLRYNPFFDDMVALIVDFLEGSATEGRRPAGVVRSSVQPALLSCRG